MTVDMGEQGSGQDYEDVQQSDLIMSGIAMIERRRWDKVSLHWGHMGRKLSSIPIMREMVVIRNIDQ